MVSNYQVLGGVEKEVFYFRAHCRVQLKAKTLTLIFDFEVLQIGVFQEVAVYGRVT